MGSEVRNKLKAVSVLKIPVHGTQNASFRSWKEEAPLSWKSGDQQRREL